MDASEEEPELELQRATSDLIADLHGSLYPLIWGTTKSGSCKIRARVKNQELNRLLNMIDTFQELPQLLDPHLVKFIPLLADSFIAHLKTPTISYTTAIPLLVSGCKAICQLLYRFCKVRGEKVVIQFFSTEARHIEVLLSAVEQWGPKEKMISSETIINDIEKEERWGWEEIYICLLWLSQLLLAPFDLASISPEECETSQYEVEDLIWPQHSPALALRTITLGLRYLSSPGKEKDAARFLLVRVSMRRDMQENGTLKSITKWALAQFTPASNSDIHHLLGVLSFLVGLLTSSVGTTIMESQLWPIFEITQEITSDKSHFEGIFNSAVARKLIIKVLRSISVIALQRNDNFSTFELVEATISHLLEAVADSATPVRLASSKALSIITLKLQPEMAEEVVDNILTAFEKNVFWVTLGEDLGENMRAIKTPHFIRESGQNPHEENLFSPNVSYLSFETRKIRRKDISRVNLFEWHGCIMALSQLIYRHAIPTRNLTPILVALRLGLSFEQRSTSGSSVGTNVRDAACFGLWALARKYKTAELQNIMIEQDNENSYFTCTSRSTLQILATDLVISATLDPAGNIRRGSAAALQELVGRHPNTIEKGIELVQLVDYHAIALRDRAIRVVALNASVLTDSYYVVILENLLGWRGVKNCDKSTRRSAAITTGRIVWARQERNSKSFSFAEIIHITDYLVSEIFLLKERESDERHGLILSFAAILNQFKHKFNREELEKFLIKIPIGLREFSTILPSELYVHGSPYTEESSTETPFFYFLRTLLRGVLSIIKEVHRSYKSYRAPQSTAEAVCELMNAAFPLLKVNFIAQEFQQKRAELRNLKSAPQIIDSSPIKGKLELGLLGTLDPLFCFSGSAPWLASQQYHAIVAAYQMKNGPPDVFMRLAKDLLDQFLKDADEESVHVISNAAANYGLLCGPRHDWFLEWQKNGLVKNTAGLRDRGRAYIHTVFKFPTDLYNRYIQPCKISSESFTSAVYSRWYSVDDIELKIIIMHCLATSSAIKEYPGDYIDLIKAGMDDYTTTSRGDVGSRLRIASIKTAIATWKNEYPFEPAHKSDMINKVIEALVPRLLRLASEKLDRVRLEAKSALLTIPISTVETKFQIMSQLGPFSTSSKAYFHCLLDIHCNLFAPFEYQDLFSDFIATFSVSAEKGSEDIIRASRAALAEFCQAMEDHLPFDSDQCSSITHNIQGSVLRALLDSVNSGVERYITPGLEILSFLISVGIIHRTVKYNSTIIFDTVERAMHNCKNFRKLEAGIKLLGAMLEIEAPEAFVILKPRAIRALTQLLINRYPKIRSLAADEIFFRTGLGKGVNWTNEKKVKEMLAMREYLLGSLAQQKNLTRITQAIGEE